jgi:hypothetical protein
MSNFAIIDTQTSRPYLGNRSWDTREAAEVMRADLLKYHPLDNEWHSRLTVKEIDEALKPPEMPKGRAGGSRNMGKQFSRKPPKATGHEHGKMLRLGPARGMLG